MKIDDLPAMRIITAQMRPFRNDFMPDSGFARISPAGDGRYLVRQGKSQALAVLENPVEAQLLDHSFSICPARLVSLTRKNPDGVFDATFRFYYGEIREMGVFDVALGREVLKKLNNNPDEFLREHIMFFGGSDPEAYFVIEERSENEETYDFILKGASYSLPVKAAEYMDKKIFTAERLLRASQEEGSPLILAHGFIHFKDYSSAKVMGELAEQQMNRLLKSDSAYLAAWDKYNDLEESLLKDRENEVGVLEYSHLQTESVSLASCRVAGLVPEALREGDWLREEGADKEKTRNRWKVVSIDQASRILKLEIKDLFLPQSGRLTLSVFGDSLQMERRKIARDKVFSGKSANPYLGLLIEDDGLLPPMKSCGKRIEPLSPFVRDRIFPYGCTDNQYEAIDFALNTPDIALIQGPPGTGKTTVIRGIVECLNETLDKKNSRGNILVCAFQHDAVHNVISRLRVNDLPQVKFGKRWNSAGENEQDRILHDWSVELAQKVREKHPDLRESESIQNLKSCYEAYLEAPVENNRRETLKAVLALPAYILTEVEAKKASSLLAEMDRAKRNRNLASRPEILRAICALRINPESYADDGQANALLVAALLPEESLDPEDLALLCQLPVNYPAGEEAFFKAMRKLRDKLRSVFGRKQEYAIPHADTDIMELYESLRGKTLSARAGGKDSVLLQFLRDLENCPGEALKAIEDCNTVYAATVQQSEGSDIRKAKLRDGRDANDRAFSYDTVIIDEAARVNPPDLLIPMARAARRIILVGDQKQLPHLLDEEMARQLEKDNPNIENLLQESMFEHIFNRLQKLSRSDGIKRTVTLNTQYRMHPRLGEFVSRQFYNGEVGSGRPESAFAHNLPDMNGLCCAWLNVPGSAGLEEKCGTSYIRIPEARAIAQRLKIWLDSPESAGLTFGVISFYRQQADRIKIEAADLGIFERHDDIYALAEKYKEGAGERVRISTVDAFQGMEFDVVFLSMTRCRDVNEFLKRRKDAKASNIFGHLTSKNRLCVALSRQEKLLVCAGDADMLRHEIAREGLPEMVAFLEMCEKTGKIL